MGWMYDGGTGWLGYHYWRCGDCGHRVVSIHGVAKGPPDRCESCHPPPQPPTPEWLAAWAVWYGIGAAAEATRLAAALGLDYLMYGDPGAEGVEAIRRYSLDLEAGAHTRGWRPRAGTVADTMRRQHGVLVRLAESDAEDPDHG